MYISLTNGVVLNVIAGERSIVEIKAEVSQRIANVATAGKLFSHDSNVLASFDCFGREMLRENNKICEN